MKLTSYHKLALLNSIRNDTPKPSDEKVLQDMQAVLVAAMSAPVRKLYKTNPKALARYYVEAWSHGLDSSHKLVAGDAPAEELLKPWYDAEATRKEVYKRIEAALKGCTTRKQVLDMFPEFEKYLPQEYEKSSNLPALANVMADLTKLGWPKAKVK